MKSWYNVIAVLLLLACSTNVVARPNDEISTKKITTTNYEKETNGISSSSSIVAVVPNSTITRGLTTPTTITANNNTLTQPKSMGHNATTGTKNQRISTSQQPKEKIENFQESGVTIQSKNIPFKQTTEHLQLPAKRIEHHENAKAHQGIAIPMTPEEMEGEMAAADIKQKDSSTSKDGISTWVLLSDINSTPQPETSLKRDDLKMYNRKIDKIARLRDSLPKPQRVSATATVTKFDLLKKKNNSTKTTTGTIITTPTSVSDLPHIKHTVSKIDQMKKLPEQPPSVLALVLKQQQPQRQQQLKQNHQQHNTSSSMEKSVISVSSNEDDEDKNDTKEFGILVTTTELSSIISKPTTKEIPTPFLILEPKDADFDLPQDRSPGKTTTKTPKRPINKNKKKNVLTKAKPNNQKLGNESENKNGTNAANKIKDKPMSTKIYNYLSREVMPTVGVGLLGLVVTAGLAGYFFGPLGALRRSYDVADRKDDLYYYNNEEYAGPGTDGQSEEEIFGKVIAGMPVNSNYRNNIHYPYQQQRVNQYHGPQQKLPTPHYHHYRSSAPNQHLSAHNLAYSAHNNQHLQRNHLSNGALASRNVISQKSINSSPVFALPQAQQPSTIVVTSKPVTPDELLITQTTTDTATSPVIMQEVESPQTEQSNRISLLDEPSTPSVMKLTDYLVPAINSNVLKHRKSQFVVGSVLSADAIDTINKSDKDATIILPEHGPRRRRRRSAQEAIISEHELKNVETLYDSLKKRFDTNEKYDKITKEMKHVDYEMVRLRRMAAEIEDIVQFQTELHIQVEHTELPDTLTIAIAQITSNIKFINELLDNPKEINEKIKNRKHMTKTIIGNGKQNQEKLTKQAIQKKIDVTNEINPISISTNKLPIETSTTEMTIISTTIDNEFPPIQPTGLLGLLKFLELKAAFGVNVLRSIRPAFDRAFEDVFRAKTIK